MMIVASLPPLPAGGAEWQALRLGEALVEKGIDVTYLTPGKGPVKGQTAIRGMPVYRLTSVLSRLFDVLSAKKTEQVKKSASPTRIEYDDRQEVTTEITRKVGWPTVVYYNIFYWNCLLFLWRRRKDFDVIHAHTMEWSAIVAARLGKTFGKPVVIKDSTMNGFSSLRRYPSGLRLQQLVRDNSEFIAMTGAIEHNLRQDGIPAEKITRIPNGIKLGDDILPLTSERPGKQVLFVGNLYQQPAKGIDILLRCWPEVVKNYPDTLLQVVGDGDIPAYQAYVEQKGIAASVRFAGKQADLTGYYRDAAVFVLPSRREGMSNALIEAMLEGLPCVATDISGNQDLIRSGSNGKLVPAGDTGALAAAICYMLANPAISLEMGRQARKTILETNDIRLVAEKYIALYKKLIAK
jgi:glycosyltransferase involved in cell wall biosynthesis